MLLQFRIQLEDQSQRIQCCRVHVFGWPLWKSAARERNVARHPCPELLKRKRENETVFLSFLGRSLYGLEGLIMFLSSAHVLSRLHLQFLGSSTGLQKAGGCPWWSRVEVVFSTAPLWSFVHGCRYKLSRSPAFDCSVDGDSGHRLANFTQFYA